MGSKFMRFGLIATAIINIILLMFVLIVRQFNYDEIIMIILAGGVVGLGMALIVQVIGSIVSNKKQ